VKTKKIPIRTCIGCRQTKPKKELIRIVRKTDGAVEFDLSGKISGRGAYLCPSLDCFHNAIKKGRVTAALEIEIGPQRLEGLKDEFIQLVSPMALTKEDK